MTRSIYAAVVLAGFGLGRPLEGFRGFVDFLRAGLDRIGPAQEDLCRDFFQRAVALELSFFEAAYPDRT